MLIDAMSITLGFLILGVILMAMELFLPGGISFLLGLSACIMAGLRHLGLITSTSTSFVVWLMLAIAMLVLMRPIMMKKFGGEEHLDPTDEDVDAMDEIVEVIEETGPEKGRVRFRGSEWPARTTDGVIASGEKGRIVLRDNVTWVIKPAGE